LAVADRTVLFFFFSWKWNFASVPVKKYKTGSLGRGWTFGEHWPRSCYFDAIANRTQVIKAAASPSRAITSPDLAANRYSFAEGFYFVAAQPYQSLLLLRGESKDTTRCE